MKLSRSFLESLIFGKEGRRYTQDSPVLPDVWIHYGDAPTEPLDLLLTPHKDSSAGALTLALRERLARERATDGADGGDAARPLRAAKVAYNGGFVVACLYVDEVVRVLLPLTAWWRDHLGEVAKTMGWRTGARLGEVLGDPERRERLIGALERLRRLGAGEFEPLDPAVPPLPVDLVWMIHVVGHLAWAMERTEEPGVVRLPGVEPEEPDTVPPPPPTAVVDALIHLVGDLAVPRGGGRPVALGECPPLYLVNRNRKIEPAVARSVLAVKADAGRRLFDIRAKDVRWAVVDSGIDALHPAFVPPPRRQEDIGPEPERKDLRNDAERLRDSRVRRTYDFSRIRLLLDPAGLDPDNPELPDSVRELLATPGEIRRHRAALRDLRNHLVTGRAFDWDLIEPLLRIPVASYEKYRPTLDHGTHVAGILGGDVPDEAVGVCPDIELLDFRVVAPGADNDEFPLLAALQFIRHLNSQSEVPVVHGVNLSLSILHDVANYACGRTPICEECERLVASGVVVVAAAGNSGYLRYVTEREGAQRTVEGYHTVSITDPGNAEGVITVGATHRSHPHTYGVSYFSSRGPTGDGRRKPDLVAPGEKITAPVPFGGLRRKDGTSMAAPHVSGAAALLMARHHELVGDPRRIKRILCDTATDLGREPYFQGAGMLDVLRALQAV